MSTKSKERFEKQPPDGRQRKVDGRCGDADSKDGLSRADDSEDKLREMARAHPLLTRAQENELFKVIRSEASTPKDIWQARESIVLQTLSQIVRLASKPRSGCGFADLCQAGIVGTMQAMSNFRPNTGKRFFVFAASYISGAMSKHWQEYGRSIRISESTHRRLNRLQQFISEFELTTGSSPNICDIATALKFRQQQVLELLLLLENYEIGSLSGGEEDDAEYEIEQYQVADVGKDSRPTIEIVEEQKALLLLREARKGAIQRSLRGLRLREREVLMLKHKRGLGLDTVASQLGITRADVDSTLRRAVRRFRSTYRDPDQASIDNRVRTKVISRSGNTNLTSDRANSKVGGEKSLTTKEANSPAVLERGSRLFKLILEWLLDKPNGVDESEFCRQVTMLIQRSRAFTNIHSIEGAAEELAYYATQHLIHYGMVIHDIEGNNVVSEAGRRWLNR